MSAALIKRVICSETTEGHLRVEMCLTESFGLPVLLTHDAGVELCGELLQYLAKGPILRAGQLKPEVITDAV